MQQPFAIPTEELLSLCQQYARRRKRSIINGGIDWEDLAQEAMLYIIRQNLCGPGTDYLLVCHIVKNKVSSALARFNKLKTNQILTDKIGQSDFKYFAGSYEPDEKELEIREIMGLATESLTPNQKKLLEKYLAHGYELTPKQSPEYKRDQANMHTIKKKMKKRLRVLKIIY